VHAGTRLAPMLAMERLRDHLTPTANLFGGVRTMRRLLLVCTAALGLAPVSPALAQQAEPAQLAPSPSPATGPRPAAQPGAPAALATPPKPVPEQAGGRVRAGSLLGVGVSNGYDTVGEVSDLIVTEDGRVEAVVVEVGGFLGLGEKRVALTWDSVMLIERDGGHVFLVSATREQLEGMPAFETMGRERAEEDAVATGQGAATPAAPPGLTPAPTSHEDGVEAAAQRPTAPGMAPATLTPAPQPGDR
jgi:PRC-barrel domain